MGRELGAAGHSQEPAHAPWPSPYGDARDIPPSEGEVIEDGPWEERERRVHEPPGPNRAQCQCEQWKHGGANRCSWAAELPALVCQMILWRFARMVAHRVVPLLPPTAIIISL
jgi:hypothetical protein